VPLGQPIEPREGPAPQSVFRFVARGDRGQCRVWDPHMAHLPGGQRIRRRGACPGL